MLIIGLTGGIGSGKSAVANLFATKGIPVIDTDVISRELTQPGEPALQAIINHYGHNLLQQDGTLNRSALRQQIFNSTVERKWLEDLLHPLIRERITALLTDLKNNSSPPAYCLLVVPLLIESNSYSFINRILVVDTPPSLQIARVTLRDNTSSDHVKAIIASQVDREIRLAHADDIIINDGSLEKLIHQVDKLHTQYEKFSKHS